MRFTTAFALVNLFSSSHALGCFSDRKANIAIDAVQALINNVGSNNFDPPLDFPIEVKAQHLIGGETQGVKFCIENNFLFDNTHVAQGDIISALETIRDDCDRFGGKRQAHGDTGLPVDITLTTSSGSPCP
ncbi:hypothetical protein FPRO04_12821 [Fusarium proliferatum]|nr:hypothetical protein FPRO04_12821 [Fusarium proliferatum]